MIRSLIINPGSTSTKIGVFEDETQVLDKTLRHEADEIGQFATVFDQIEFRKQIKSGEYGVHASNLGGILAREIADEIDVPAYIVDPVVVDEMIPIARYSGLPEFPRKSIFHALNQKAMGRRYAKENGARYEDLNLIVVHMGGGCSVAAHEKGRVIDVFNALDGDGAFSPERSGALPVGQLIHYCFTSGKTEQEMRKMIVGKAGFNAYLNTIDARIVDEKMQEGDAYAKEVFDAFIFQICKNIGAEAAVLCGKVDQIILTGGIAYDKYVGEEITKRVSFIAPVTIYGGEDELLALAQGALRVLNGEEAAKEY